MHLRLEEQRKRRKIQVYSVKEKCKDCRFWDSHDTVEKLGELGWCSRYPPQISKEDKDSTEKAASWPNTFEFHWCGEFELKDE